jgi:YesN/AraC family two-component response regulator
MQTAMILTTSNVAAQRSTAQKEIARSLGYKDVASFARVFRKVTG